MMENTVRMNVEVTREQNRIITDFCNRHGYKKAAWLRKLAMDAVARDIAVQSGATQIDPAFFQGGRA
jgi:phage-related protein